MRRDREPGVAMTRQFHVYGAPFVGRRTRNIVACNQSEIHADQSHCATYFVRLHFYERFIEERGLDMWQIPANWTRIECDCNATAFRREVVSLRELI